RRATGPHRRRRPDILPEAEYVVFREISGGFGPFVGEGMVHRRADDTETRTMSCSVAPEPGGEQTDLRRVEAAAERGHLSVPPVGDRCRDRLARAAVDPMAVVQRRGTEERLSRAVGAVARRTELTVQCATRRHGVVVAASGGERENVIGHVRDALLA